MYANCKYSKLDSLTLLPATPPQYYGVGVYFLLVSAVDW